jgi:hypothetical protein
VHEVVRVVRVRHIVTHVSSIGQFFQFHIVAVPLDWEPSGQCVLARVRGGTVRGPGARSPRRAAARVVTPRPRAARLYKPRRRQAAAASPRGAAKADLGPLHAALHCGCWERPLEVQFWIRKTSPPLSTESRFENRTSSGWPRLQGLNFNLNLPDFAVRAESFAGTPLDSTGAQERVRSRLRLGQYQRPFPCHRCAGKVISANAYSM